MNHNMPRPLSREELDAFERDGIALVKGIFDDDWIERMRHAVDDVLTRPSERMGDLNPQGKPGRFVYDNYLWTFNDDFRALSFESPVPEIAAAAMASDRVNLLYDFILVKEPRSPHGETRWHQDTYGNPCEGRQTMGLWLSLDHVTLDSGAVEWVRGSHLWGRRFEATTTGDPDRHGFLGGAAAEAGPKRPEDMVEPMPDIAGNRGDYDIIWFETEPGDCLIAKLGLVHGAPGNGTDRRRRAIGYRLVGDDARYAVRPTARSIRPYADPGLGHGDPFPADPGHRVFPQTWPRPAPREAGAGQRGGNGAGSVDARQAAT